MSLQICTNASIIAFKAFRVSCVLRVALWCKLSPSQYLDCVWKSSQLAGEAVASTTESHLTNRLATAGGLRQEQTQRTLTW